MNRQTVECVTRRAPVSCKWVSRDTSAASVLSLHCAAAFLAPPSSRGVDHHFACAWMGLEWDIALHCCILAFNACHALYNDAKPVISTVDRSHASSRITKHVGRGPESPAVTAMCVRPLAPRLCQPSSTRYGRWLLGFRGSIVCSLPAGAKAEYMSIELFTLCGGLEGVVGGGGAIWEYEREGILWYAGHAM